MHKSKGISLLTFGLALFSIIVIGGLAVILIQGTIQPSEDGIETTITQTGTQCTSQTTPKHVLVNY